MLLYKKTLKTFELLDTTIYKDKVDLIIKNALPSNKLLKRKKTINLVNNGTTSSNNVPTDEN